MKIVATSDLHGSFPEIPECDLLIVAGDICDVFQSHEVAVQRRFLRYEFTIWLETVPAKEIVWIAGNHDFVAEIPGFHRNVTDHIPGHYLLDSSVEIEGFKVYGTPWVPVLKNWAFYGDEATLNEKFNQIPIDTDILVSHGPPLGLLDTALGNRSAGSAELMRRLLRIQPQLHVFGHIHEAYGEIDLGNTQFANVSHMDVDYKPVNPPKVFEL